MNFYDRGITNQRSQTSISVEPSTSANAIFGGCLSLFVWASPAAANISPLFFESYFPVGLKALSIDDEDGCADDGADDEEGAGSFTSPLLVV